MINIDSYLENCTLCPRRCGVDRTKGLAGFCGQTTAIRCARAALHFGEEPIISGTQGSGAVFFSGCNLRCIFCQNHDIAIGNCGKEISLQRLSDIFLELQSKGANNINLVTGAPYIPQLANALELSKSKGLAIPVLYNSSGYENVEALKLLDGLVNIYLPDMKYFSSELSAKYSKAPDYFERACEAIAEMYRQVGAAKISTIKPMSTKEASTKEIPMSELLSSGLVVRHLVLPGNTKDSKKVLRYLYETYKDNIYISIMNQYTPLAQVQNIPELNRKVTEKEYDRVVNFAIRLGINKAFTQDGEAIGESFIPAFDYEGL